MFVLELYCFFNNPSDAGNLISGSSAFSKTSLNLWKFLVQVLLKPGLENFEHYFTSMWSEHNCAVVWGFFGTAFLKDWKEKKINEERAENTPQGRWDWHWNDEVWRFSREGFYVFIYVGVDWQFWLTFASYTTTNSIEHIFPIIQSVIIIWLYV